MAAQGVPLTITKLFDAVKKGRLDLIQSPLNLFGIPKSGPKTTDYLILQTALKKNQREIAKLLINAGCRVKPMLTERGMTPLALAFLLEDEEISLMILKRGTTIYVDNNNNSTILHFAAQRKLLKMLKFIFICNIDVNLLDSSGKTTLQILLETHNNPKSCNQNEEMSKLEMIRFLLSKNASVNFRSSDGQTALHYVVSLKKDDIIKTVLEKFTDVNLCDNQGKTALHALLYGDCTSENDTFEIVKLFIQKGANINIQDGQNVTVSHIVAGKKYLNILFYFLQCNCTVSLQDSNGNTILHTILENSAHLSNNKTFIQLVDIMCAVFLENIKNSSGTTPIHLAAENRHYKIFEKMLPKLKNINDTNENGESLLHILLNKFPKENYVFIKYLLELGANVDLKTKTGLTPINLASKVGYEYVLLQLISHSKDPNQYIFEQSRSILHYLSDIRFSFENHEMLIEEIAKTCIEKGANINALDKSSRTPLLAAVMNENKNMVKVLLEHGAKSSTPDTDDLAEYLILKSTLSSRGIEIADMLVSKGVGTNITFNGLLSLLKHVHSQEAKILIVKVLNKCKNINVIDSSGNTILHALLNSSINTKNSCEEDVRKIVEILLTKGISVDAKNKAGATALHLAAKNKHDVVSEFLLRNGASIDILDNANNSVLHFVAMSNLDTDDSVEKNLIDLFVAKGSNVNARNKSGITPLVIAAKFGCITVMKALINHGAVFKYPTDENLSSPLHIAAEFGYPVFCIQYFLECGENVYAKRKDGKTAIHIAAIYGRYDIMKTLIKIWVDPDVRDNDGRTALHWACWHGHLDIAMALLSVGADVNAVDNLKVTPLMLSQNSNNTVWKTLQRHLQKLEIVGVHIARQNVDCINKYKKRVDTTQLASQAQLEVMQMKQKHIKSNITLADVMKMKLNKLIVLQNNITFQDIMSSPDIDKEFPIYYSIIMACYIKCTVRNNLLMEAQKGLRQMSQLALPLDVCANKIFEFLSNEDLINLTIAAQSKGIKRKRIDLTEEEECAPSKKIKSNVLHQRRSNNTQ